MKFSRSDLWSKTLVVFLLAVGVVLYDRIPESVPKGGTNAWLAALFVILGSFMENVERNGFYGIRMPWTLANDEVWSRSNRFGGRLFVLAGVLLFAITLLGVGGNAPLLVLVTIAGGVSTVYSYLVHREVTRRDPGGPSV
jgi:uncharacterized membrane protein